MDHYFYFYPEVQILLINEAEEKTKLNYNGTVFELPKIGQRPPYYCKPKYEQYYPII